MEAEAEVRVIEKDYASKRAAGEATAENISKAEAERAKREREEADARAKAEAEIKEKAEKIKKSRDANSEAETAERERSCDEAKDRDNFLLKRQQAKGVLLGQRSVFDDSAVSALAYNWKN